MSNILTKSGLNPLDFEAQIGGEEVRLFVLTNQQGAEVCASNFGGFIASVWVPSKDGSFKDVVLGHQTLQDYINTPERYLGSVVGRYANRIANGTFELDGTTYRLAVNNGPNHLHGGSEGYNWRVWQAVQPDAQTLELTYVSPDGEEGYPGELTVTMIYRLTEDNALQIEYFATTDQPTVCNLTNHAFFNLSGQGEPTIEDHYLTIHADLFTPANEVSIPSGEIVPVKETPMDFTQSTRIGERIDDPYDQLIWGKGYDHNYVIRRQHPGQTVLCATAISSKSGIVLEAYTNAPGVQLYTGNWLGGFEGKQGAHYPERSAFCLETQHFPDSPNKGHFPACILRPGDTYHHLCIYKFSIKS